MLEEDKDVQQDRLVPFRQFHFPESDCMRLDSMQPRKVTLLGSHSQGRDREKLTTEARLKRKDDMYCC
jgi:hypothetical protein